MNSAPHQAGVSAAVRASQHPVHLGWIGQQAGRSRLSQHPFESDFRQAALRLWITATDIAMDAGEPNLLEVSQSPGCDRAPEIWPEERSPFVDRYRVPADLNIWRCRVVGEGFRSSLRNSRCPIRLRNMGHTAYRKNAVKRITGAAMGITEIDLPWAGTFHAVGARILREFADQIGLKPSFTILDRRPL
jgi:hypothetical protein